MVKHWCKTHNDQNAPPPFKFRVIRKHNDPLSRKVHEAVRISTHASVNSKAEWGGFQLSRLSIEKSDYEMTKELADVENAKTSEAVEIAALKARVDAHNLVSNVLISSRKRKVEMSAAKEQKVVTGAAVNGSTGAVPKRKRVEAPGDSPANAISTGKGTWDPKKSKFTRKQANVKPKKPLPPNLVAWLRKDICPSTSTPTNPLLQRPMTPLILMIKLMIARSPLKTLLVPAPFRKCQW